MSSMLCNVVLLADYDVMLFYLSGMLRNNFIWIIKIEANDIIYHVIDLIIGV